MMVKCSVCGNKIDKSTAYVVEVDVNKRDGTIGKKKVNVCSESEWFQKLKTDSERDEMWKLIQKHIGSTSNTLLTKEAKLWGAPGRVIAFINNNEDKFNIMNTKVFDTEYHKIRYFSAIIKNNINDMPEEIVEAPIKVVDLEWYENKHKNIRRRKCLSDYE